MSLEASVEHRISRANITKNELPVQFKGKTYTINTLNTSSGEFLVQASHCASILFGTEEAVSSENFRTVSKRCDVLQHQNKKLEDHLQVVKIFMKCTRGYSGLFKCNSFYHDS